MPGTFKILMLFSPLPMLILLLVGLNVEWALAQYELTTATGGDLRQHSAFVSLPSPVKALVDSALKYYNQMPDPPKSIAALQKIDALHSIYEYPRIFRAWIYQWLAFNYDLLKQADSVKTYVRLSTKTNMEIWHDYKYFRVPETVQDAFQEHWTALQERFAKQHNNFRMGFGPIIRADFTTRYGITAGLGTAVKTRAVNDSTQLFQNLLLYGRRQWMRKNIERLTAGLYGEFSLLFPLEKRTWKTLGKVSPLKAISFGPVLGYANQSSWELGGTIEAIRLDIGRNKTRISQTTTLKTNLAFLSYANFEVYFRKWF